MCKTCKKKNLKWFKYIFFLFAYKSQDFVQSQENFAQSHDYETVTFKNVDDRTLQEISEDPGFGTWKIKFSITISS